VAVDEAAPLRVGQECDGPCDVLGLREAGHRDAALDVRIGVAACSLVFFVHLRLDPAGADGVYADAASSPLGCEGAGQADETVFARVVRDPVGDSEQPGHGADVDDAS
jgi:hypothetical protein